MTQVVESPVRPRPPGRRGATAVAVVLAVLALLVPVGHAPADPVGGVRVVASFDPAAGHNPEDLAVGSAGTVYVTWLSAHAVVAVRPDGSQAVVTLPAGQATGIVLDPLHPDQLAVGMASTDPAVAGIWTVPLSAFAGVGTPVRRVALPTRSFANGLAFTADGTLYVSDSTDSLILRVAPGATTATTWLSSTLLTPTGATYQGNTVPGVNGLDVYQGALYAANTARGLLLRIPLTPRGPGVPTIVRSGLGIDDFAIDEHGVVTAAIIVANQVARFAGDGPVVVLADLAHGDIQNPTAVEFGPHDDVYVTSSAYFGTQPALQLIER